MRGARMRVAAIIYEAAQAAINNLLKEKNVEKGDTWLVESYQKLAEDSNEERDEYYLDMAFGRYDETISEFGDMINAHAMEVAKAEADGLFKPEIRSPTKEVPKQ